MDDKAYIEEIINYLRHGLNRNEISKLIYGQIYIEYTDAKDPYNETHKRFNHLFSAAVISLKNEKTAEKNKMIERFKQSEKHLKIEKMEKIKIEKN